MINKKRILVCPLDWGLGHATRCIPIIRELEKQNTEVIIGANDRPLELLKKEFPHLQFIKFNGYNISYPRSGNMNLKMFFSAPKILWKIFQEHQQLKKIIREHKIDIVISDNQYGLWNKNIPCVFITHQIMIKCPSYLKFLEPLLYLMNLFFINKYNECWIPDLETKENLSGDLSHKYPLPKNARFIGTLSRFNQSTNQPINQSTNYDIMVILSGPEPQRTMFEEKIIDQICEVNLKTLIVRGTPEQNENKKLSDKITVISHLESEKMKEAILSSKIILSRSGYSTVMDLVALGKKAIFIPTPGQTEQEYLARFYKQKKTFYSEPQSTFNLKRCIAEAEKHKGLQIPSTENKLADTINHLITNTKITLL